MRIKGSDYMNDEEQMYAQVQAKKVIPGCLRLVSVPSDKRERLEFVRDGEEAGEKYIDRPARSLGQRRRSAQGGVIQSDDLSQKAAERTFGSATPRVEHDSEDDLLVSCGRQRAGPRVMMED
jgi:hypothetical protein